MTKPRGTFANFLAKKNFYLGARYDLVFSRSFRLLVHKVLLLGSGLEGIDDLWYHTGDLSPICQLRSLRGQPEGLIGLPKGLRVWEAR